MTRVAVTGLGAISPHGDDPTTLFAALMRGESALKPIFPELPKPAVAAVAPFDETRWFTKLQLAGVDRVSRIAVGAADLAMRHAEAGAACAPERLGVYAGCGMGGAAALDTAYRGGARVPPLTIPAFMPNAPAGHVAMRIQARGPVMTYSVACASSAVAIAEAAKAIRSGEVDIAIAGGTEALLVPGVVVAWQAMQTLATFDDGRAAEAVRPFSSDRTGFALGEGAAFLVLESEAHAKARGASIRGYLDGWGTTCDATHLTKPDQHGQVRALEAALRQAGLTPADVGYCNAHGTATRIGDVVERNALATAWGDAFDGLRVSSTKALHGHLLGGAGALEALITVQALIERRVPPNAHCTAIDPECRMNVVLAPGTEVPDLAHAITNSFAFGGTNCVLLFSRA